MRTSPRAVSNRRTFFVGLFVAALASPAAISAQAAPPPSSARSQARHISITLAGASIADVLTAFSAFSGASIVAGAGIEGSVTADINDQPWDVALASILTGHGLLAVEDEAGIIRVDPINRIHKREAMEPIVTRVYRISYSRASELQAAVAGILSPRGTLSVVASTNTLIVSDVGRVQRAVASLLR
jgi:type II secretory pathway component GspD/PulD (secretin)